jgi:NTE family protein
MAKRNRTKISIALAGGGSKGMAHLGVLSRLEQEGVQIEAIAGTSMGGIVGAFYAAGRSPDWIINYFQSLELSQLFSRHTKNTPSLLGMDGIRQMLDENFGDLTIKDLSIPLAVTAVDLNLGQEAVLTDGRVVDALLATSAIPGIFPPQIINDHTLVDGGLVDPVPVAPARALAPRLPVVAVVLSRPLGVPITPLDTPTALRRSRIMRYLERLRYVQAFNMYINTLEAASRTLTELHLKLDHPDVVIRPDVFDIGVLDPVDIEEVAQRGWRATEMALPKLDQAMRWQAKLSRRFRNAEV